MDSLGSTATSIIVGLLILLGLFLPAFLCSVIGARKGYNATIFLLLGLLASVAGLIIAVVLPSRHEQVQVGTVARIQRDVALDDGRHLPRGLLCRVLDLKIDTTGPEGVVVCQLEDPLGESHWIARSVLVPA